MARHILRSILCVTAACTAASVSGGGSAAPREVDVLIAGGTVFAGDEAPPRIADVAISGDKIVFVGDARRAGIRGRRTIAAKGMMVAPGFIDAHVHDDAELTSKDAGERLVARQAMQGVTTSVIGVDGEGTPDIAALFAGYEQAGVGQNVASYVGFGNIRMKVLGESARAPTPSELQSMKALAAKGMCEGALGLSSGLFYAPQTFASTDEVIAVAKEAGRRGGLYDTHQRDEGDSSVGVIPSLKEAIRIGAESGAPLHLAHIKVTDLGRSNGRLMAEMLAMIEAARAQGQPVTADQYPWAAANTGLESAVIPRWAQDGGREAMVKRFADPADAARIKTEMAAKLTPALAATILIDSAPGQPELLGKRLSELATQWGVTPIEAAMRALDKGDIAVAVFVMKEADVRAAMVKPWVFSSSDGRSGGHPRAFASFPKLWTDYVVAQKVLTPTQFVHRSTGLSADVLGLKHRGYLRTGYFADVVVFDPARFQPRATFVQPTQLATGVVDLVVNGRLEVDGGKPTGVLAGRGLKRMPTPGTCPGGTGL